MREVSSMGFVSGRTRGKWDAFYKNQHDQNKQTKKQSDDVIKKCSDPVNIISDGSDSDDDDDDDDDDKKPKKNPTRRKRKTAKKPTIAQELDYSSSQELNNDLVRVKKYTVSADDVTLTGSALPLKFKFPAKEEELVKQKTDLEIENESLFADLEMCLLETEEKRCNFSSISDDECRDSDEYEFPATRCDRGEHETRLDEQIGIVCKYCLAVLLEIRYVLPPFVTSKGGGSKPASTNTAKNDVENDRFTKGSSSENLESGCGDLESSPIQYPKGTVFDLIPNADKRQLYPHQLEGFEFLWRNIAGGINIDELQTLPAKGGTGCIISHAPGTGKTRLTIAFLQTFMKLYPNCRPVIVAPSGMLLTWEQEFKKWDVDIKFDHLNSNCENIRSAKLRAWEAGEGILGISYRLFSELAGGRKTKKTLLEKPGLLVLDEGHNPRNERSQSWMALSKVETRRRVILSGTPFQNNGAELRNTFCLVNPRFPLRRKRKSINDEWSNLMSSIGNSGDDVELNKVRSMIEPFVHIYQGGILKKTLPGMRDFLIILKPTDLQMKLLAESQPGNKFFKQEHLASLISVHPALVHNEPEFSKHKRDVKLVEFNPDAGVKTRFLVKIIELSGRLGEKVLVFSQYLKPLEHTKSLLAKHFRWKEGREMIYLDGNQKMDERQRLMNSFNDKQSEAKVMLASQKACSEGISLVGASRVVLLDVVWNPSVARQAICRAYRLGQEKVVHVYRLLIPAELNKYARQAEKERVSELIFSSGVRTATNRCDEKDEVLEAMVGHHSLGGMFEKVVYQPKESAYF